MNLVTGLWGMNVKVPGQDVEDNLHWFFGVSCAGCHHLHGALADQSWRGVQIVGCLIAFAIGGAWLTYRVSTGLVLPARM